MKIIKILGTFLVVFPIIVCLLIISFVLVFKGSGIINCSWLWVKIPFIVCFGYMFILFVTMQLLERYNNRDNKNYDRELKKIKFLLEVSKKDSNAVKFVVDNLNIYSKKYEKMSLEELKDYTRNEPRKKQARERIKKLKKLKF